MVLPWVLSQQSAGQPVAAVVAEDIQDAPSIKSEERTLHHLGGGLSRRTSRNIIITKIIIIIERQRE